MKQKRFQYIKVILYPLVVSGLAVLAWKFLLKDNGLYFSADAEAPILYMIIPPVGFIYVIFASLAVNSVFDKFKRLRQSVTRKDIAEYITYRDQQLPVLMHFLVAIPSLVLLFIVVTYQYNDLSAGIATVFLVTLVISLTWMVIYQLDNDHKKPARRTHAPSHWHTTQAEDYFKEEGRP